jgi:hypothetical protein
MGHRIPIILKQASFIRNSPSQSRIDCRNGKTPAIPFFRGMAGAHDAGQGPGPFLPETFEGASEGHPGPGNAAAVLGGVLLVLGKFRGKGFHRVVLCHSHCLENKFFVQHANLSFLDFR